MAVSFIGGGNRSIQRKPPENYVYKQTPVSTSHNTEMLEIITNSYKGRSIQMFAGATITGNVTINFTEFELNQ